MGGNVLRVVGREVLQLAGLVVMVVGEEHYVVHNDALRTRTST